MQRQTTSYKGLVHPKNQKKKKYYESRISSESKYTNTGLLLFIILVVVLCTFPFLYLWDWIKIVTG